MFNKLNVPILGVIENMSYLEMPDGSRMDIFGNGGGQSLALETNSPFLGEIPMDSLVRIGGDNGQPIVLAHPEKPAAKALRSIAENLAAQLSIHAVANAEVIIED
jgi:ATP-binding protein involved in chromosome partitioning